MDERIRQTILMIPAILVAFTFHEYAHAAVADRLGDRTPRFQGRLTFNPIAHIDLLGFIMILIAGFGWAKPVQTNPSAFKRYYKDHLKVAVAGPLANLLVAILFTPILGLYSSYLIQLISNQNLAEVLFYILYYIIRINVALFIFNLLPIPGLDGYHALADLFPSTFNRLGSKIYQYEIIILIIFLATPISGYIIRTPRDWIVTQLLSLASYI